MKSQFSPISASINPPVRKHWRWVLIISCALALALSVFSISLMSVPGWLVAFQIFNIAIYSLLITGEAAKLKHPLARDLARYPGLRMPPRLLDGAQFSSPLTVLAILSALAGTGLCVHSIRADRAVAIAKQNLAAQVAAARDKFFEDSRRLQLFSSTHHLGSPTAGAVPAWLSLTPAEHAMLNGLLKASANSSGTYARLLATKPPQPIADRVASLLLLLTALPPILWLMRWRWTWQWKSWCRENNRCAGCGYDLRATIDRCPECGMLIPSGGGAETSYATV